MEISNNFDSNHINQEIYPSLINNQIEKQSVPTMLTQVNLNKVFFLIFFKRIHQFIILFKKQTLQN